MLFDTILRGHFLHCFFVKFVFKDENISGRRALWLLNLHKNGTKLLNCDVFLNGPFSASFSFFRLFNTVGRKQIFYIKVCQWLVSNRGPLLLEAAALPAMPQPLP